MTPPPAPDPAAVEALPDLTLAECCQRWGVNSRNSVKARAAALGVELRQESSTRTVWPAEWVALGDQLQEHLRAGGKLANFPGAVTAPAAVSDGSGPDAQPLARRSAAPSLPAPAGGTDALAALAQFAAALAPPAPPPDPLTVARGLAEAADLRAWLSTRELAALLGVSASTIRGWPNGHQPRPGFVLEKRSENPRSCWWRVNDAPD